MELGIHIVNFNLAGGPQALGPTMAATARAAEQGGATMFTLDRWNPRRRVEQLAEPTPCERPAGSGCPHMIVADIAPWGTANR
jgi:hypothetical protein